MKTDNLAAIKAALSRIKIVPTLVIQDPEKAVPVARALMEGGVATVEVTFRTAAAAEAIRRIAAELPECLVGAGTVLTPQTAKEAMDCGAKYIVSPGLNPEVVKFCQNAGFPMIPGVATPTEIEMGLALGLDTFKFFPAEANGGCGMLKNFASPYGGVTFLPTGGVDDANVADYLVLPNVFACGGSWVCPPDLVAAGDYKTITRLAREAVTQISSL